MNSMLSNVTTDRLLTPEDVARFLGVHVETVKRLLRNGALDGFKVGKKWRVRSEALQRFVAQQGGER